MKLNLENWQLHSLSHPEFKEPISATVPGCVHTDLLEHGLIPDPYLDLNETKVQWVSEADWQYSTSFELDETHLTSDALELVCFGLDTVATIFVNGQTVASTQNMHRAFRFDIKEYVQKGSNNLHIEFYSNLKWATEQQATLGDLPNAYVGVPFNFIRKMACNFGWDWGPILTTSGIWQPIFIEAWNTSKIDTVRPLISLNDHLSVASFDVQVDMLGSPEGTELEFKLFDAQNNLVHSGSGTNFDIANPELWWPVGYGSQPLYKLEVSLKSSGQILDTWTKKIGIRKVELDTSFDDIGSAFTFVINNKTVFIKGANWIPDDCFPTRVTRERYDLRITQALDANMNMLRIWGGGIYENDTFYELCDEKGMLVWQDFLFACAAYPEEEPYWSELEAEAAYQVTRLACHPSLVLWNGNNENLWGYISWDWQRELGTRTWGEGYYLDLLPKTVESLDPTRPYYAGSPYSGSLDLHPLADNHGCKHVWDAWNECDYSVYRAYVPRFVSEFGHQAPPTFSTLAESISERPLQSDSPAVLHHQKATNGNEKLHARLTEHFNLPEDVHLWHYATQLNQARAIDYGVSHWRSSAPICMGTLYWQLNDCWPVTSWAAVDGYGRKKPLWYATRRFYADRLLTIQPKRDELALYIINDSDDVWTDTITIERFDFSGRVLESNEFEIEVKARASQHIFLESGFHANNKTQEFLRANSASSASSATTNTFYFFDIDKRLSYPEANFDVTVEANDDGYSVEVTAKSFVRDLVLFADKLEADAETSEQLVSLLPNERYTFEVQASTVPSVEELREARALLCANDL